MEIAVTRKRGRPKKKFRGVPFKKKNLIGIPTSQLNFHVELIALDFFYFLEFEIIMEIAVTRKRGRPKKKFRGVPFKKKNVVNFQESTVVSLINIVVPPASKDSPTHFV